MLKTKIFHDESIEELEETVNDFINSAISSEIDIHHIYPMSSTVIHSTIVTFHITIVYEANY